MIKIRKGTLADEQVIAGLISELAEAVGALREVNPVSWYSTLRKMIASPEWTFLIAEDENKPVGLLVLLVLPSLYYGANLGAITELIVKKEYRGKGIGKLLVQEAKSLAKKMGCAELDVSVEVQNEDAIGFYQRLGFKKKHADFWMEI